MGSNDTRIGEGAEFSVAINKLLDSYQKEMQAAATIVFNSLAKECVQRLRDTSPQNQRSKKGGAYAKSWTLKQTSTKQRQGIETVTVYNKDYYQLTHLLEKGHDLPQGGRAQSKEHIAPVANWAASEIDRRLKEKL